jgi:hypothetical protein
MEKIIEKRLLTAKKQQATDYKFITKNELKILAEAIATDIKKELKYLNREEVEKIFMTYVDETEYEAQLFILGSDVSEIVSKICDLAILLDIKSKLKLVAEGEVTYSEGKIGWSYPALSPNKMVEYRGKNIRIWIEEL